jgi:hypothetical protein
MRVTVVLDKRQLADADIRLAKFDPDPTAQGDPGGYNPLFL